uniref:(northern house mosquito) hypothetical protein n=1 Tax=Culex pipiens TaxID=7175 RepID=A0A8D8KTK7_CULPI
MERTLHGDRVGQLGAALSRPGPLELPEGLVAWAADGVLGEHLGALQWGAGEPGAEHGFADGRIFGGFFFEGVAPSPPQPRAAATGEDGGAGDGAERVED